MFSQQFSDVWMTFRKERKCDEPQDTLRHAAYVAYNIG